MDEEKKISIYGLIDPRNGDCFYIGKTYADKMDRRLIQHVAESRRSGPDSRKHKRILAILDSGENPRIESLEEVPESQWGQAERAKIAEYRQFCELTNVSPGGQGPSNWNEVFTQAWDGNPERRRLISQQSKERWSNPEYRAYMIAALKEHYADPAKRAEAARKQREAWANNEGARNAVSQARLASWQDPDYRERVTRSNVKAWSDPERLEQHSKRTAELWQDPEYREKVVAGMNDPEVIAKRKDALTEYWTEEARRERGEISSRLWDDPEFRERMIEIRQESAPKISQSLKEYYEANPEEKERLARQQAEYWANPEAREKRSDVSKALWKDPEFRAKQDAVSGERSERMHEWATEYWADGENVEAAKELARKRWQDPEYRARQAESQRKRYAREKAAKEPNDVEKAAKVLGLAIRTVYGYCQSGKLGRKEGNSWVITDEDIARFRDDH